MADVPYFNLLGAGKGCQKLRIVHRVGQLHEPFMGGVELISSLKNALASEKIAGFG